jgi:RimJ/RimL family protein N-acetyltransferase
MTTTGFSCTLTLADGRTVVVRKLSAGDGPGIRDFLESFSPASWELLPAHATTDPVINRRIERALNDDDWVYVALAGERVVAYFFLWMIQDAVPLLGIGVADAFQNQGLGQQLVRILIEDAKALGKDGIELTTMLKNARGLHIYQKLGFQYLGTVENEVTGRGIEIEHSLFMPLVPGAVLPKRKHEMPA